MSSRMVRASLLTVALGLASSAGGARAQDDKLPAYVDDVGGLVTPMQSGAVVFALPLHPPAPGDMLLLVSGPRRASTDAQGADIPATPGEVLVLLGTGGTGGIDPSLRGLAALRQAPLRAYPEIRVLSRRRLTLRSAPTAITLPNGRRLTVSILAAEGDGYRVLAILSPRPSQPDAQPTRMTLHATSGQPFFAFGDSHLGGTLIVGITVGTPRPR